MEKQEVLDLLDRYANSGEPERRHDAEVVVFGFDADKGYCYAQSLNSVDHDVKHFADEQREFYMGEIAWVVSRKDLIAFLNEKGEKHE